MSELVVSVTRRYDPDVAVGVEQGAVYVLTGPDGQRAVLNDPSDDDHVGFLTAPPGGIDSPEVRESADVIVEGDGGVHGRFYFGRRPVTLEGIIDTRPHPLLDVDPDTGLPYEAGRITNRRVNRLQRASRAMTGDASLEWQPAGAPPVRIGVRRQQPLRVTNRLPKAFSLGLVAADPFVYAQITKSVGGALAAPSTATSDGNAGSYPVITFRGPWTNPELRNDADGGRLLRVAIALASNDVLELDGNRGTVLLNGSNRYGSLVFPASEWWHVLPGDNALVPAGTPSGAASYTVAWRDAWV